MVVIMHCPYGEPDRVVAFTDANEAVNYAKKHLKGWDIYNEEYQAEVDDIESVEDAQVVIAENAVYTMQIWVVDEIDPKDIK